MISWHIKHVGKAQSTNSVAMDMVLKKGSDPFSNLRGCVIVAEEQSAGRGQYDRSWISPKGGLYMSAILGDLRVELRPMAALLSGIAVAEAIESQGITPVGLRWPNDVVIHGKKVAGILCEGVATGSHWMGIAGVGVNVNMPIDALPRVLATKAATLFSHDGKVRDLDLLCRSILDHLAHWMSAAPGKLVNAIRQRDVLHGRQITVADQQDTITGIANGIDAKGALLLTTDSGEHSIAVGSIISVDGISIR